MTEATLAFDRQSVRTFDADGIMHVARTPISKANVCKYQGREIPMAEELGLDPDKWYNVYRDPAELAKGAETFNNKPILSTHKAFSTETPPKELIVGMTGDDAAFDFPYLYNSMSIFDGKQQAGIESDKHREISSSYYWTPDLTPGVSPEGDEYDIVMRDLICNHVAIVPDGRAGNDVLVYDHKPTGYKIMTKLEKFWQKILPKLANDADPDALKKELDDAVDDEDPESDKEKDKREKDEKDKAKKKDKPAEDSDKEEKIKALEAELAKIKETAEDAEEKADEKVKAAMDSLRTEHKALREAERICAPYVGTLACDSAEELFRATLEHAGVDDVANLPVSALKPMVQMLGKKTANDSAPTRVNHDVKADVLKMIRGGKA